MLLDNIVLIAFGRKISISSLCLAASFESFEGAFKTVDRSLLRVYSDVNGFNVFKMGPVGLEFSKAVKYILQHPPPPVKYLRANRSFSVHETDESRPQVPGIS